MVTDVPMPPRIAALPRDSRGYPVPWFVQWIDGVPDFRIMSAEKLYLAVKFKRCWVCGGERGKFASFVIGPMCAVNRNSAEPPCHLYCARYSAQACPFLTRPKMRRNEKGLPLEALESSAAGIALDRNPGVALVWTSQDWKAVRPPAGREGDTGVLFDIGNPTSYEWFAEGRRATRAEIVASIDSGLPALMKLAEEEGPAAVAELGRMRDRALTLVPA